RQLARLAGHAATAAQHGVEAAHLGDLLALDDALQDLAVFPQIPRDAHRFGHFVAPVSPNTSCMSYNPGGLPTTHCAARTAPRAKLSRLVARWVSSSRSPSARKKTV